MLVSLLGEDFLRSQYFRKCGRADCQSVAGWYPNVTDFAAQSGLTLDKSKKFLYVLMGEHTKSTDSVSAIRQSDSAGVLRATAQAPGLVWARHIHAGDCGLVNAQAPAGRQANTGH